MNDANITSWAYNNGVVNIPSVVGNVTITAAAIKAVNNQLSKSTDTDGSIYNGVGYKANTYLSSGAAATDSGYYTSGFIPCKKGDTVYFKNCTIQKGVNRHRICCYDSTKTYLTNRQSTMANADSESNWIYTFDSNGILISGIPNTAYLADTAYIRFCCSYLGPDSVVTVNEPID